MDPFSVMAMNAFPLTSQAGMGLAGVAGGAEQPIMEAMFPNTAEVVGQMYTGAPGGPAAAKGLNPTDLMSAMRAVQFGQQAGGGGGMRGGAGSGGLAGAINPGRTSEWAPYLIDPRGAPSLSRILGMR